MCNNYYMHIQVNYNGEYNKYPILMIGYVSFRYYTTRNIRYYEEQRSFIVIFDPNHKVCTLQSFI